MYGNGLTPLFIVGVTNVILPSRGQNFGEELLLRSKSRYIKAKMLSERCQYGLFLKEASRKNEITVSGRAEMRGDGLSRDFVRSNDGM